MRRSATDQIEADIEKPAVKYAESRGWKVRKVRWLCRRGAPDRFFVRRGRIIFIEFKALGEPLDVHQQIEIAELRSEGIEVFVIDNLRTAYEILH
jgi:Holliday junction resolvase-like predicted endonuclease